MTQLSAIRTHLSRRFHLATRLTSLCWTWPRSQIVKRPQDAPGNGLLVTEHLMSGPGYRQTSSGFSGEVRFPLVNGRARHDFPIPRELGPLIARNPTSHTSERLN